MYAAFTVGTLYTLLNAGVSLAGPKLTPETFQQGLFSDARRTAAPRATRSSPHVRLRPAPGLPYDVYSTVGLDYAVMWWSPTDIGKGKILFDDGTGRSVHRRRQAVRSRVKGAEWKKGEPKLFDHEQLDLAVRRRSRSRTRCPTTPAPAARASRADDHATVRRRADSARRLRVACCVPCPPAS